MKRASLHENGWTLANAEAYYEIDPTSTDWPTPDERKNLQSGMVTQLRFLLLVMNSLNTHVVAERLRVQIVRCTSHCYEGILLDPPTKSNTIRMGQRVQFLPEHVFTILTD